MKNTQSKMKEDHVSQLHEKHIKNSKNDKGYITKQHVDNSDKML